jgi:hypothetical protein
MLIYLNYLLKGPFSKYTHTECYSLNIQILGEDKSVHNDNPHLAPISGQNP